ncbi:MAG: ATP-binding cassette domain-containing protein [Desulfobacterales bacterium]|nr:ATP-binding cassette domain-containing protein [Desulfobacterales bacterium]
MDICYPPGQTPHPNRLRVQPGQAWCITGRLGSGLDDFLHKLAGTNPQLGEISFRAHQDVYEAEVKKDDTDFMDRMDPGTPARDFLPAPQTAEESGEHDALVQALGMAPHLDTGYRGLSTGQSRKLLLLSALMAKAEGLILQDPFDGLDPASCKELDMALETLFNRGIPLILFLRNPGDIPGWITHAGRVASGELVARGPMADMVSRIEHDLEGDTAHFPRRAEAVYGRDDPPSQATEQAGIPIIELKKGRAGYGEKIIFDQLDLTLYPGEHTLVTGPNGCGKSTLLAVVTGDHPACYTNDLHLFGIRRGSGESIWELKQRMGIVSPGLHRDWRVPGDVVSCILSGLFDSIGLYQIPTPAQKEQALQWLERLDMLDLAHAPFRELSFARQRLVLIARALVKAPELLVLDEPTQGLDRPHRGAVLDFLESVAQRGGTTLLYVSHRQDEFRSFFRNHLNLG